MFKMTIREMLSTLREEGIALFVRGATGTLIAGILAMVVGFLSTVVLTRLMGANEYGLYVYVMSWLAITSLVSQLGFRPVLVRFIAAYIATQQWGRARGIITYTAAISVVTSVLVCTIAGLIVWLASDRVGASNAQAFLVALPLAVLITIASLREASLRALKRVVLSVIPETIIRPVLIALGVALSAVFLNSAVNASQALVVNIFATLVVFLIGTILLFKVLPPIVRKSRPEYEVRIWS
jgi:O-antigen/teichoic acid export membrane protein